MSNIFLTQLGDDVSKKLSSKESLTIYKSTIDKYLSANTDKYFVSGPTERPVFSTDQINQYITMVGLTRDKINQTIKSSKSIGDTWHIMNNPFNVANVLATRYFAIKKQSEYIKLSKWYLIISMYPSLHFKYFKYGTNEACMNYTVANLTGKFKLKQTGNMWNTLTDIVDTTYELHEPRIIKSEDMSFVKYIQDVHTRLNSIMKNLANEYYKNFQNQKYLQSEHESFDEDSYHEADSTSYVIDRLTNKVVTHLIVNGPDLKLVQLAAKTNTVSVNQLRTYTNTIINDNHREDIQTVVESLLYLYLNAPDVHHTEADIGTTDFMIYCLQVYKRSNTKDKTILTIKSVLDKWLKELGITDTVTRAATLINFKRALYTFFVMSIQKIVG